MHADDGVLEIDFYEEARGRNARFDLTSAIQLADLAIDQIGRCVAVERTGSAPAPLRIQGRRGERGVRALRSVVAVHRGDARRQEDEKSADHRAQREPTTTASVVPRALIPPESVYRRTSLHLD